MSTSDNSNGTPEVSFDECSTDLNKPIYTPMDTGFSEPMSQLSPRSIERLTTYYNTYSRVPGNGSPTSPSAIDEDIPGKKEDEEHFNSITAGLRSGYDFEKRFQEQEEEQDLDSVVAGLDREYEFGNTLWQKDEDEENQEENNVASEDQIQTTFPGEECPEEPFRFRYPRPFRVTWKPRLPTATNEPENDECPEEPFRFRYPRRFTVTRKPTLPRATTDPEHHKVAKEVSSTPPSPSRAEDDEYSRATTEHKDYPKPPSFRETSPGRCRNTFRRSSIPEEIDNSSSSLCNYMDEETSSHESGFQEETSDNL